MITVALNHYLILGACMFIIGVLGIFLNRRNLISLLMCIELILLSVNMNFVSFSSWHPWNAALANPDPTGQVFVFFILVVAAAESAIGLAILVLLFRKISSINVDDIASLKG